MNAGFGNDVGRFERPQIVVEDVDDEIQHLLRVVNIVWDLAQVRALVLRPHQ